MKKSLQMLLLLVGLLTHPCLSQDQPEQDEQNLFPSGYSQFWVDKTATVSSGTVQATVAELKKQQSDPEQIIVFIHGFKKPRQGSTRDYNALAKNVRTRFAEHNTRVGIVGVQWDSSTNVPNSNGLNALKMLGEYKEAISLARSVGRGPTRELLLAVQEKFPKAHLSVFAHSMGCEVAAAALLPEIEYQKHLPFVPVYHRNEHLQLSMLVLAGSDLDYDVWYKSNLSARDIEKRSRLTWFTVADYLTPGDKVLNTRKRIRGRAGGSSFPRMTLEQLDQTVSERRIFIDQTDIPRDHRFLEYYTDARLARIEAALRYLTAARAPQPDEIAEIDEILAAPYDLEVLLPFLDRPSYASKFYAMWRIERVNCGDARHMTDLTLDRITELLRKNPKKILEQRVNHECVTVRNKQFPSPKALKEAGIPYDQQ